MTTNKPEAKRFYGQNARGVLCVRAEDYKALQAECEKLRKDAARLDWLADMSNPNGHVMLPTECVEMNLGDMRAAIDAAMEM